MYALRPATEADHDFLYRLHTATMKEYVTTLWGWDEAAQQRMFRERFNPALRQVIVVDGQDAGALEVHWGEAEAFISNILIAPEFQRRGIGRAILKDILDEATARGLPVTLRVLRPNPARGLYERLGFVVTEETPERFYLRREA
jgi:ribosomal protein S18 acetylase RimI-like enzyme